MKRAALVMYLLLISACGFNGDQKVSVRDSNHNINVIFTFIQQIKDLCTAQTNPADYPTAFLYNKAIADCTFKNLSLLNMQQIVEGCALPDLTPEQQQLCGYLGL